MPFMNGWGQIMSISTLTICFIVLLTFTMQVKAIKHSACVVLLAISGLAATFSYGEQVDEDSAAKAASSFLESRTGSEKPLGKS